MRLIDAVGILLCTVVAVLAAVAVFGRRTSDLVAQAPDFDVNRAWHDVGVVAKEPHPNGSREHEAVREFILRELQGAGLEVRVQEASVCTLIVFARNCGRVRNVVARFPGTAGGDAVLLAAHYDSVPTSFGAADDGAAVASLLEVARHLRSDPAPRNDVILLFTDSEEDGLLGATAFVRDDPAAKRVRAFVNFEARGNHGASTMYAVTRNSAPLIRAFSDSTVRPASDSFLTVLASIVPNGADSMVFEQAGIPGLSFAFADGLEAYHTQRDVIRSMDMGSLAHHGVQALALTRALGKMDLGTPSTEANPTHFDVLGRFSVTYPAWLAKILALAAVAAVAATFARQRRAIVDALAAVGVLVGTAVGVSVLAALLTRDASLESIATRAFTWCLELALVVGCIVAAFSQYRGAGPWRLSWTRGFALLFGAITALLAIVAPAASFAFAFPALALVAQSHLPEGAANPLPTGTVRRLAWWVLAAVPLYVFGRLAAISTVMSGAAAPALPAIFGLMALAGAASRFHATKLSWSFLIAAILGGSLYAVVAPGSSPIPHERTFASAPAALSAAGSGPPPSVTVEARTPIADRTRLALFIQPARGGGGKIQITESTGARVDLARYDGAPPEPLARFSLETDQRLIRMVYPALVPSTFNLFLIAPRAEGERLELDVPPGAQLRIIECTDRSRDDSCVAAPPMAF